MQVWFTQLAVFLLKDIRIQCYCYDKPEYRPILFLLFHAVSGAAYRQYLLQNATKARINRQIHYHKLERTLLDLAVKFQSLINSTASTMY